MALLRDLLGRRRCASLPPKCKIAIGFANTSGNAVLWQYFFARASHCASNARRLSIVIPAAIRIGSYSNLARKLPPHRLR